MAERKAKWTIACAIVALATATVEAADKKGWGMSAALGASEIRDRDDADTFRGNGFGYAIEFEYRFSPNFALGAGGFSLGDANDTFNSVDTRIEVRGYNLFARLIYPISDGVDFYGRVGAANYFVDIEPGSVSFSDALFGEDAVELGLGVDFGRREKLAFRLEGRYFNGGRDETGGLLMLGFNYLF